jgi:signal recognition particle receptor subunit beta
MIEVAAPELEETVMTSEGVIFVVDMTDFSSLEDMIHLRTRFRSTFMPNATIIIAATKFDVATKAIPRDRLNQLAMDMNLSVFFVSSLTGQNY